MTYTEWLAGLKTGDPVIVSFIDILTLSSVHKKTRTQIMVGPTRYNVSDGQARGGASWHSGCLLIPTESSVAQIHARDRRDELRQTNWNAESFTDETINAIYDFVQEAQAVPEEPKVAISSDTLQEWIDSILGMSVESVLAEAKELDAEYRVTKRDGLPSTVTRDYRPCRLSVEVEGGLITKAYFG